MKEVEFLWKAEKPEDFIVKEVSDFEGDERGENYLYLLAKRNYATRELSDLLGFSYAGMKDKFALTFQKVSFSSFKGEYLGKVEGERWYFLKFIKRIRKKVKVGNLKGNRFAVKLNFPFIPKCVFVNYYDVQRIRGNYKKGRELLLKGKRRLSWRENFLIDSYLSYLWNKSLELYLKERFKGYYVLDRGEKFFIPLGLEEKYLQLPKFWTLLGYKKKLLTSEPYYEKVLKEEGVSLRELLNLLKALGIKGDYRMSYVFVRDFKVIGRYCHFFLPKGSFATMFLKHLQRI